MLMEGLWSGLIKIHDRARKFRAQYSVGRRNWNYKINRTDFIVSGSVLAKNLLEIEINWLGTSCQKFWHKTYVIRTNFSHLKNAD